MNDSVKVYFIGGVEQLTLRGSVCEESASVGTVKGLIDALELPEHKVGTTLVNGKYAPRDCPLKPGDEVALFPPRG